jgi:hypothetical protein
MSGSRVRNLLFVVLLLAAGCGPLERGSSVPRADTVRALPLGLPNARYYADGDPAPLIAEGLAALAREEAVLTSQGVSLRQLPPVSYLAVSGGGANGAFGAGLLNGWTRTRDTLISDRERGRVSDGELPGEFFRCRCILQLHVVG